MQFKVLSGTVTDFVFEINEAQTDNNYHNSQTISIYNATSNISNPTVSRIGPDSYGNYYNEIKKSGSFSGFSRTRNTHRNYCRWR